MKKNLIFLTLLISVLMVSVVSAGITGYALSLREGRTALAGDLKVSNVQVEGGVGSVDVEGVQVRGREGETVTTSQGESITFQRVKGATFFTKPKIEIVVTPKVAGVGSSGTLKSITEEECSENCQTFTEVYEVEEGQIISINGDIISIDFINANQIKLDVNGQITPLLNEGNTFELSDGKIVVVKNVLKLEVGGTIGKVKLGVLSSYKLEEGQQISIAGDTISIDFISATQVVLMVNGQTTNLLSKDNTFELTNGQIVVVNEVRKLEVGGEIGWVVLDPSSCYFLF